MCEQNNEQMILYKLDKYKNKLNINPTNEIYKQK